MKTSPRTVLILLVATLAACAGFAAQDDANRATPAAELAALEQFLSLSDAQLDQLQAALARIRALSPAERAAFAEEILSYRALPGEQRRQIREGWGRHSRDSREDWRALMQSLNPQERARVQQELQALPPEQRLQRRLELLDQWRNPATSP